MKASLLVIFIAMVLLGCNGARQQTAQRTQLRIAVESSYVAYFQQLATDFSKIHDIDIQVIASDMFTIVDALPVQRNNSADIFMLPHDRLGDLVRQRLIAPLDFIPTGYTPSSVDATMRDGQSYMLPMSADTTLLLYNADKTTSIPQWFADIEPHQLAAKYTDFYYQAGLMHAFGGYIFASPFDVSLGVANEGSVRAGEVVQSFYGSGITHWTLMRDDTVAYDIMQKALIDGDVEFIINGPWGVKDLHDAGVNVRAAVIPDWSPTHPYQPLTSTKGMAINAYSRQVGLARQFLHFVATPEHASLWHEMTQEVSPHLSVVYLEGSIAKVLAEAIARGVAIPNSYAMAKVWDPMADALKQIASGQNVQDALQAAERRIVREIG